MYCLRRPVLAAADARAEFAALRSARTLRFIDDWSRQAKDMIEAALAQSNGRVAGPRGAAAKLGIPPSTLESKIRQLKIEKGRFTSAP